MDSKDNTSVKTSGGCVAQLAKMTSIAPETIELTADALGTIFYRIMFIPV